jgi:protein-S-isoprenylcysteine O-methyltransferase Ste14
MELFPLALFWLLYCILHSLLATLRVKHWVARQHPDWLPAYRLIFNLLAVLLLTPGAWLTYQYPGVMLWQWQGVAAWIVNGIAGIALLGLLFSSPYDLQAFLGLRQRQTRTDRVEDEESFRISPLHRFVRHPWYFLGLLLIWTRDMNQSMLLSGIMLTLYLIIGSRLEEHKLLVYHGDVYREYMARVPGLFPLPWKFLRQDEADLLLSKTDGIRK